MQRKVNEMDIEKLAYDHGANIYENGEVRFYTLNAFNKFAEAYHQAKCNEELQTLRAKVASADVLVEALREITYSHDGYARKKAEQALATYDKLSEGKYDTK